MIGNIPSGREFGKAAWVGKLAEHCSKSFGFEIRARMVTTSCFPIRMLLAALP